jgi:hypothetical protein
MRRVTTTLALGLCLLGCGPSVLPGDRVALLTGVEGCYAGAQSPSYAGVLVPDPEYGTRIDGRPVMWTVGYTGMRLPTGEIAVLNTSGEVIATTGKAYAISPAPFQPGEAGRLLQRLNAIPAPDCYPWDFVEVPPQR